MTGAWLMRRAGAMVVVGVVCVFRVATAQEVGTVAALEGTAEIGRGGEFSPASVGTAIQRGDEIRTARPGKVRVVFQDDSVLSVSDDSTVIVNEQVFDGERGTAKSLMDLVRGKVDAVVSDYYHRSGNTYQVKTATAVAGVRGTEFAMTFDPDAQTTEVIGVSGHIEVHSMVDPTGPGVLITANEATTIEAGKDPTRPRRLEDRIFRQRLEGIDFVGRGQAESLSRGLALTGGGSVPGADRAAAVTGGQGAPGALAGTTLASRNDPASLIGKTPDMIKAISGQLGIGIGH